MPEGCESQSSLQMMRRERVYLCDASSLINTEGFINSKENKLWIQQRSNRGVGGNKADLFYGNKGDDNCCKFNYISSATGESEELP